MSETYTPNPANSPSAYTAPQDGDLKPVSSVRVMLEGVADKAAHATWPESDATKSYPLASQTLFRVPVYNAVPQMTDGNGNAFTAYKWAYELGQWIQIDVSSAFYLDQELDLPDGATLLNVYVNLAGTTGARTHTNLPGTMPSFRVFRINSATGVTSNMSNVISDTASPVATYNAAHQTTVPINANAVIDRTAYRYFLRIIGEAGANSVASALGFLGANAEWTTTKMDKGAA